MWVCVVCVMYVVMKDRYIRVKGNPFSAGKAVRLSVCLIDLKSMSNGRRGCDVIYSIESYSTDKGEHVILF